MDQPDPNNDHHGRAARRVGAWIVVLIVAAVVIHLAMVLPVGEESTDPAPGDPIGFLDDKSWTPTALEQEEVAESPLDAKRAYGYLKKICDLGPRPSGSRAMKRQQTLVTEHFESLGGEVELQRFRMPNPLGGPKVPMANVVARWNPDATERLLLCAHYDTRPLPDRDPDPRARREGTFIGANDGASGVALLMEIAHLLEEYDGPWGVDIVLFDGEELVYQDRRDPYFLGSQWFARQYAKQRERQGWEYRWAVLVDMVGDADLQVHYERHSHSWPETRPLTQELWRIAGELGVEEFVPTVKHEVLDDHLALRRFGGIPAIDLIDFDYPYWHTRGDTADKCSGESLAKVGWVVWEWVLRSQPEQTTPEATR